MLHRFSTFTRLQRVTAYCYRFTQNCRNPSNKVTGPLTIHELTTALQIWLKIEQQHFFTPELRRLKSGLQVKNNSKLKTLNPFVDDHHIIHVGGRLVNTELKESQRYPIVLPASSYLSYLIARYEHIRHLHAGPQLLLTALRQKFWPLNARNMVRKIVHKCVTCFKNKPTASQPQMGNLPSLRTTPSRPFINSGVDYCGPVYIRSGPTKRSSLMKTYIAVFVCFSTKAIHLELVSNLTSEAFLAAFKRFTSRRGVCQNVYSDNGTNFIGAYNELKELQKQLQDKGHQDKIINFSSVQNTKWHFIPANSPHFGGLWEAGVKAVKYHLRRVLGNTNMTFEELYTTLTLIEACLNSRPLTPLSSDPNDPLPLSPGHFLTGDALTSLPDPDLTTIPLNRLSKWQHTQQLMQHFWRRWSKEYLAELQQRRKWTTSTKDIQPGQVVIVRDDNLPPLKWITAVVKEVHPGTDGRVRVATVKTSSGLLKRAVNRLCVLPIDG